MRAVVLSLLWCGCNPQGAGVGVGVGSDLAVGSFDLGVGGGSDLAGGEAADLAVGSNGNRGSVVLFSGTYLIGTSSMTASSASAEFDVVSGSYMSSCASSVPVGDCRLVSGCTLTGGPGTFLPQSAGVVTIGGGKHLVTLTPGGNGKYLPYSDGMNTLWNGGETLAISAQGGIVPAFSGSLIAPAPFGLTAPAFPTAGSFTVDRSQDLVLSWTGGGSGLITLSIEDGSKSPFVECYFPAANGIGTIPKMAFQSLAPGATGTFSMSIGTSQSLTAADWSIYLAANVPPTQNGKYLGIVQLAIP